MITENLSTLKIHKLTKEQYERESANGNLDTSALYLTPEEEIDLSRYATIGSIPTATSQLTNDSGFITDVVSSLGYAPVQQGGGVGQLTNKVNIGWSGERLKVTVDETDLGNVVFDNKLTHVLDKTTGTPIYLDYGSEGLTTTDWVAAWNGYELRAISPATLKNVMGVSSGGSGMTREFNTGAINAESYTTSDNDSKIYIVTASPDGVIGLTFVFDYMAASSAGGEYQVSQSFGDNDYYVRMIINSGTVTFKSQDISIVHICGYY